LDISKGSPKRLCNDVHPSAAMAAPSLTFAIRTELALIARAFRAYSSSNDRATGVNGAPAVIASETLLLAKQQEEFRAWHRHWVSEWRVLEGARNM
jgi:hypothetical protein